MTAPWSTASTSALRQLRMAATSTQGAGSNAIASSSRAVGSSAVRISARHASTSVVINIASRQLRLDFTLPTLPSFLQPPTPPSSASLALATEAPATSSISSEFEETESSEDPLQWDGFLNAVPKKKVSHSRKRMRAANKGLKDRVDFNHCPGCGHPKPTHHICASCFGDIARRQKAEARAAKQAVELQPSPEAPATNQQQQA